jgi:hypothetical protein
METQLQDYFNGLCCPAPVATFNFDVTADWASKNVTDKASFESLLVDSPNAIVNDFKLSNGRLQANVSNLVLLELENFNLSISNFKIPNVAGSVSIANNGMSSSDVNFIVEFILANVTELVGWNSAGNDLPSSANQLAINNLCESNGGSAPF